MKKLIEHTNGTHIYMKIQLDRGKIEEIDVYLRNDGAHYVTSADHGKKLCGRNSMEEKKLDRLCDLLERLEKNGDAETAAALREAILKIENL